VDEPAKRASLRILIIGGYGTFGGRLVQLLKIEPCVTLLVAGRSLTKARRFCEQLTNVSATLIPISFDRTGDLIKQLTETKPDWLVDASGPFQDYGDQPYEVVKACIAAGVHYLDLADGSNFVSGIKAFDDSARKAKVFALSGVSSFPMLTAAIVRRLQSRVPHISAIHAGIAPSPFAGVGINVIKAVASYAGQRTSVKRNNQIEIGYPITDSMNFTIAVAGQIPLRERRFSLVDVPDLNVLNELWPEAEEVWMGAAPEPRVLHRILFFFSWCVRLRLLPSLSSLAPLISWTIDHLRWGEHRGGMFVQVRGLDKDKREITLQWHLLAEGDDGPLLPSMAVNALVLRALSGELPAYGARAAISEIELHHYESLFVSRKLYTGEREPEPNPQQPLYQQILGQAWNALPAPIRTLHLAQSPCEFSGRCSVVRGRGIIASILASVVGFPLAGVDQLICVRFDKHHKSDRRFEQTWTRTIGARTFHSTMFTGSGSWHRLLCERFGPATFALALTTDPKGVRLILRAWRLFGIPMPMRTAPQVNALEFSCQGKFNFHIELSHPWIGLIVQYRGWLIPAAPRNGT
jgi:hypothetical protein